VTLLDETHPPLVQIERAVQARAKEVSLDLSAADGEAGLRTLIDNEIGRWAGEYRRGRRPYELADPEAVSERAFRNLAGYGPLAPLLG